MYTSLILNVISVAGGAVSAIVAWLIADARSKTRLAFMEEKVTLLKTNLKESDSKISSLELAVAKAEQAQEETRHNILRLDDTKASKEVVEGFRNEIQTLKSDMDKRFDRLERILEKKS